jgi:hypothetical protein
MPVTALTVAVIGRTALLTDPTLLIGVLALTTLMSAPIMPSSSGTSGST